MLTSGGQVRGDYCAGEEAAVERGDTACWRLSQSILGQTAGSTVMSSAGSRTCCRALGIAIYERQRPADLAAARSGFTALTRVAHDQCDAWTGLAAAGDTSIRVLEAVSRTSPTAGALQRQVELAPGCPGLPLRHRPVSAVPRDRPGRFPARLRGGAGVTGGAEKFAKADEFVTGRHRAAARAGARPAGSRS